MKASWTYVLGPHGTTLFLFLWPRRLITNMNPLAGVHLFVRVVSLGSPWSMWAEAALHFCKVRLGLATALYGTHCV